MMDSCGESELRDLSCTAYVKGFMTFCYMCVCSQLLQLSEGLPLLLPERLEIKMNLTTSDQKH